MDYKITVTDYDTHAPIAGADIRIRSAEPPYETLLILTTGPDGTVTLTDREHGAALENGENTVVIDAPGYYEQATGVNQLWPENTFEFSKREKPFPWILVALGTGLVISANPAKKQRVTGIDVKPYIIPLAGVTFMGILVYKVGQKFGLFDDATAKKQKEEAAQREADQQRSMAEICRATPTTKSDADWITIANKLEGAFDYAGYLQAYRDEAVYQLARAKNDCDVQKLIYYFGHRALKSPFLIKSGDYTLSKAILERLSRADVDTINDNYRRKGIAFTW